MLVIVLGLVVGLAAGIVAGWRTPPFAAGLRAGLGVGLLAGTLLVGGAAHSGLLLSNAAYPSVLSQLAQIPQLSWLTQLTWLTRLSQLTHLTLIAALVSGALCVALSVTVGGLTSGWTGYQRPASQPRPEARATPVGPLPTPA